MAICAIARQENRYICEWLDYYRSIGVAKVYLYDNYHGDEERLSDVVNPYVDAGFVEHDRMIGQTGLTVRPKLYIACGISGQLQHTIGMQESTVIVSINTDPDAPINAIADYVIIGRVEEVVPKMIKHYAQLLHR